MPGEEEHFAHPSRGDVCNWVRVDRSLWRSLAGEPTRLVIPAVYIDARLELVHRRFLAGVADGDVDYALAEGLLELGFADQAHLSRTVREHIGHSPTALRRLMREGRCPACSPVD